MPKRSDPKVAVSFRLTPAGARRIKRFLADYAGKPLFLKPSSFAEAALLREVQRLELVLSGALPLDRVAGGGADDGGDPPTTPPTPSRRRTPPINSMPT